VGYVPLRETDDVDESGAVPKFRRLASPAAAVRGAAPLPSATCEVSSPAKSAGTPVDDVEALAGRRGFMRARE
jgi:hypothetical protein